MWLESSSGLIVDSQLVRPEEALPRAAGLFHLATREPHVGEPRMPRRVRVSDEALAHALRGLVGDVEVVLAATPEIDEVVAALHDRFARGSREDGEDDEGDEEEGGERTYIGPDMQASDVGRMFAAAARLYRAQPWKVIPPDAFVSVRCEQMGIDEGALCVVGQMGESFGFSLMRTIEDAQAFVDAADAHERGEDVTEMAAHWMFMFDDRRELPEELVREIVDERWEVAGPRAYPACVAVDADLVSRGLTRSELDGITAVLTALAELVETEGEEVMDAWEGGESLEHETTVSTPHGDVTVVIGAPLWLDEHGPDDVEVKVDIGSSGEGDVTGDVGEIDEAAARVTSLVAEDGNFDEDLFDAHRDAFIDLFLATVESADDWLDVAETLVDYAAAHLGTTFVGMTPAQMNELLFEVLPANLNAGPEVADEIVQGMRALLLVADGACGSQTASQCLAVLDDTTVPRLAKELGNTAKFGRTKRMFIAGAEAGYDLTTEAGLLAWAEAASAGEFDDVVDGTSKPTSNAKPKTKAASSAKAKPTAKASSSANAKPTAKTKPNGKARPSVKAQPSAKARPNGKAKPSAKAKPNANARATATKSKAAMPKATNSKAAMPKTAKSKAAKSKAATPKAGMPKAAKSKAATPKAARLKAAKPKASARATNTTKATRNAGAGSRSAARKASSSTRMQKRR